VDEIEHRLRARANLDRGFERSHRPRFGMAAAQPANETRTAPVHPPYVNACGKSKPQAMPPLSTTAESTAYSKRPLPSPPAELRRVADRQAGTSPPWGP
jgi:hypothetical protein